VFTRQKGVSFTRFVDVILLVNGIKISRPHGQHAGTGSQPCSACTLIACAIETRVDLDCPAPFALEDFRENDTGSKDSRRKRGISGPLIDKAKPIFTTLERYKHGNVQRTRGIGW